MLGLGEIFAVGSVLCFVVSNVIFRRIDTKVSPSQINAFRTIIGFLTYLIIALAISKFTLIFNFPPILWFWLALSFFFGQVLGDTSYFKAQEILGTTVALAISMTYPIFTTIISFILGIDIPIYFYGSMALIIIGVIIIGFGKNGFKKTGNIVEQESEISNENNIIENNSNEDNSKQESNKQEIPEINNQENSSKLKTKSVKLLAFAIFLALFAAISWSVGVILTEKAITDVSNILGSDNYSSLLGNVVRFPIAASFLSLMSIGDKKVKIKMWGKKTWLFLFIGALIGTSLGAYLYTEAIFRVSAVFVSIIASASPLFSIPISWLFNKEKINILEIVGVLFTISGVVLILVFQLITKVS